MRVFVTGATGFVGSAVVQELLNAGHTVLGLVRSNASADKLKAAGAEPIHGTIEDIDVIKRGASECDGVLHLAFNHDFTKYEESCANDVKAIEAIGDVLAGTGKPFVVTSGTLGLRMRPIATEDEIKDPKALSSPRGLSEIRATELASKGVRSSILRLSPSTHDTDVMGFVTMLINIAKEKGVSAYVGDGTQRWPAVHKLDAAKLYLLALEKGSGGRAYHAVGEQGVAIKDIAEAIGRKLNLSVVSKSPEEAGEHFGFLSWPLSIDNPTSSEKTQKELGWTPTHAGLLEDIEKGTYVES